jgi:hypothetical protein
LRSGPAFPPGQLSFEQIQNPVKLGKHFLSSLQGKSEQRIQTLRRESAGVLERRSNVKYQIPSTKLQINLKFQYLMTKTYFEFLLLG